MLAENTNWGSKPRRDQCFHLSATLPPVVESALSNTLLCAQAQRFPSPQPAPVPVPDGLIRVSRAHLSMLTACWHSPRLLVLTVRYLLLLAAAAFFPIPSDRLAVLTSQSHALTAPLRRGHLHGVLARLRDCGKSRWAVITDTVTLDCNHGHGNVGL